MGDRLPGPPPGPPPPHPQQQHAYGYGPPGPLYPPPAYGGPCGAFPPPATRPPFGMPPPAAGMMGNPPDDPELAELEAQAAAIEAEAAAADAEERRRRVEAAWAAHRAPDGRTFYHNAETGESSWVRPAGFRGDADVGALPTPVAQAAIGDTGWIEVKTADGRRYWYNRAGGGEATWAEPAEVAAWKRGAGAEAAANARRMRQQAEEQHAAAQRQLASTLPPEAEAAAAAAAAAVVGSGGGGGVASAEALRRMHIERAAAARAAGGGGAPADSREARLASFKALLADAGVNGFSYFDKMRPKLEKDPRWALLPTTAMRRAVFEEFCKAAGSQQKAAKEAEAKAAAAGFDALLDEALALERRVAAELAAAVDEGAAAAAAAAAQEEGEDFAGGGGGRGSGSGSDAAAAAADAAVYRALAYACLERYWGEDPRWTALPDAARRDAHRRKFGAAIAAAEARLARAEAERAAAFAAALTALGVAANTRWRDVSAELRAHPAGAALGSDAAREAAFRAHVDALRAREDAAAAAERDERRRRDDAEARLRAQEREAEQRRLRAEHATAAARYRTLLAEAVRDPDASYPEWRGRLAKDAQRRAAHPALSRGDLEGLFEEHTRGLRAAIVDAAQEALALALVGLLPPVLADAGAAMRAAAAAAAAAQKGGGGGMGGGSGGVADVVWPRVDALLLPRPLVDYECIAGDGGGDDGGGGGDVTVATVRASLGADARWQRASEDARRAAWEAWTEEWVYGRPPSMKPAPPPPLPPALGRAADMALDAPLPPPSSRYDSGPDHRRDDDERRRGGRSRGRPRSRSRSRSRSRGAGRGRHRRSRSRSLSRHRRRSRSRSRSRSRGYDRRGGSGRSARERQQQRLGRSSSSRSRSRSRS